MSGKERGLFQIIFKNFIASFKPTRHKLIGEDYYGTKYYEIENPRSRRKNSPRYFVPVNKDDDTQEVPVEWEAWLRYRRKDPPTREEIEKNYQLQMIKKQNAAEIEAKYGLQKVKQTSEETHTPFPVYEEYKNYGQDYKIKYDKQKQKKDK
ncbi:NADH dehydrogenase [ubiquinone] 1 alpha subcomplex assembly factor 2 [Bombus pascuorum]|uniref:NADH dehydrogenase [ubiquinone] 1 alpha subcomplex assembly factor 2 n=1 Tax=Bombus pascuorum TaxID=65598 RepID=UPI00213C7FB1|nr:NADH dehydrogenase [ubiquinone] 1 alpha subcomplex assembly factor 2 [Bombus pascuorum]XP_060825299.1 NADH dehydrogenase [ubiquinone] 1 alpha subcomplex assembly factor 2 [Bombus pascuorum]